MSNRTPRSHLALVGACIIAAACNDPGRGGFFVRPDVTDTATTEVVDTTDATALDTVASDTGTRVDTSTPADTTTTSDATQPACSEGLLCDDKNACTRNDRCKQGVCTGEPLPCQDEFECTDDVCTDGVCQHPQKAGTCLIGGACYNEGDTRSENACLRCDTASSSIGWSMTTGSCDDGDPCTIGETCSNGTCGNGTPGPGCATGPKECLYHTDCYPERICGVWVNAGKSLCSEPCAGDIDCGVGQICSKAPGSVQVGYCQDAPTVGGSNGAACTEDYQCASGICGDGVCGPLCLDEAHCPAPNMTCHPVGDLDLGLLSSTCTPDSGGALGIGAVCTTDGQSFDSGVCASGHCDLMAMSNPEAKCLPICKSESDCPGFLECNIVIFGPRDRADAIPYDPQFQAKTRDAISACFTPETPGGNLGDGAICTSKAQCRSNKCIPLIPGSNQPYCTGFCARDSDCPGNMACKLDVVNMVSDWLIAAGTATPGAYGLVRICKFR